LFKLCVRLGSRCRPSTLRRNRLTSHSSGRLRRRLIQALGLMERVSLTNVEDSVLAMAEDAFVHFKTARPVLGTFYERNVSFRELSSIVGHLSSLGLIRWRIKQRGTMHFRKRAPVSSQHNCTAAFTATAKGKAYLAQPQRSA
jgi:hypothetical protein